MSDTIQLDVHRAADIAEKVQVPVLLAKTANPELMTKEELIDYLRIPLVSTAKDFSNAVENLRRMHDLPSISICGKPLYPLKAIQEWIIKNTQGGI